MKDDCERIDIRMQGVGGKELHMNDTDVDYRYRGMETVVES